MFESLLEKEGLLIIHKVESVLVVEEELALEAFPKALLSGFLTLTGYKEQDDRNDEKRPD